MKSTFERILRNELKKLDDGNEAVRRALYDRARREVTKKATRADGSIDAVAHERMTGALADAITIIESEHGEIDLSPLDQAEKVKSGIGGLLGMTSAAAAIAAGMDFFSVVLNGVLGLSSMAVYMLAGLAGLGLTGALMRIPAFSEYRLRLRDGFRAAAAVALVGAVAFGATMLSPEARQRGLIATFVPGAAEKQDDLLGRLEQASLETAEGVKRIEEKVSVLKKETSDDPCKELVNLGYACNQDSIHEAVLESNARVVGLYLDAGRRIPGETIAWYLMPPFKASANDVQAVAQELMAGGELVDHAVCTSDAIDLAVREWNQAEFLTDPATPRELLDFFIRFCGKDNLVSRFSNLLQSSDEPPAGKAEAMRAAEACYNAKPGSTAYKKSGDIMEIREQAMLLYSAAFAEAYAVNPEREDVATLSAARQLGESAVSTAVNDFAATHLNDAANVSHADLIDFITREGCSAGASRQAPRPGGGSRDVYEKALAVVKSG